MISDFIATPRRSRLWLLVAQVLALFSIVSFSFDLEGGCVCPPNIDFVYQLKKRLNAVGNSNIKDPWWHAIDDKMGGFAFARAMGVAAPDTLSCLFVRPLRNSRLSKEAVMKQIVARLEKLIETYGSFVIKPAEGFSSHGVFIVRNGNVTRVTDLSKGSSGAASLASIAGSMVQSPKRGSSGAEWQVESLITPTTPGAFEDYKFMVFGDKIASIDYIRRTKGSPCGFVVDETMKKRLYRDTCLLLDTSANKNGGCSRKVSLTSRRKPYVFKRCSAAQLRSTVIVQATGGFPEHKFVTNPKSKAIYKKMIEDVKKMGKAINTHMRIDMMINGDDGKPYIGEFTPFNRDAMMICAFDYSAKTETDKMCYLGNMWNEMGLENTTRWGSDAPLVKLPDIDGIPFLKVYARHKDHEMPQNWKRKCMGNGMKAEGFHIIG